MSTRTCQYCGTPLAPNVLFCTQCGTRNPPAPPKAAPDYIEAGPFDETFISSHNSNPRETTTAPQPYAQYQQASLVPPPPPPYNQPDLPHYQAATLPNYSPFTPPPPARKSRTGLILVISLLLVALIGGGVLLFLLPKIITNTPPQGQGTPTSIQASATALTQQNATATATTADPYVLNSGRLVINDPMRDNSLGYRWDASSISNGGCTFRDGSYHIHAPQKGWLCSTQDTTLTFTNLVFEADLTWVQGNEEAITARLNQNTHTYYAFFLYNTGNYSIDAVVNNKVSKTIGDSNAAIKTGKNQTNRLALVIQGSSISLYVNHQLLRTLSDSTIGQSGQIGLIAYSTSGACEVVASNIRVWQL